MVIPETLPLFENNKEKSRRYLFELIRTARQAYMTRNKNGIPLFNVIHSYFKMFLFPSTIIELNNLQSNIRNSESLIIFKKHILASSDLPQIVPFIVTTLTV